MSTVIRIKRQLNADPLDAVLLNCKRLKVDENEGEDSPDSSTVLKFAGTIESSDEDIFKHIKKPTKAETEAQYKKHSSNVIEKIRQQNQLASKNNRFRIVNTFRSNDSSELNNAIGSNEKCTVVDVETDLKVEVGTSNESDKSNAKFVYDLYYASCNDFDDSDIHELISVYPLSDGLIYDPRGNDDDSDSDHSEDSNSETNWRNDYPDESDVESMEENDDDSINEEHMLRAMKRVTLADEDDLSSDDYAEAYGYGEEYGRKYDKFKAIHSKDDFCHYEEYDGSCTP